MRKFLLTVFCLLSIHLFSQNQSVDPLFYQKGYRTFEDIPFGDGSSVIKMSHRYSDGKLLVLGTYFNGFTDKWFLARLQPDGEYDLGFGQGGKCKLEFTQYESVEEFEVSADGKIYLLLYSKVGSRLNSWNLLRFTNDGRRDTSFGENGIFFKDIFPELSTIGEHIYMPLSFVVLNNSQLCLLLQASSATYLVRLNDSLHIDRAFGDSGIVKINTPGIGKMALDPSGNIFVAIGGDWACHVSKYDPNGKLVPSFMQKLIKTNETVYVTSITQKPQFAPNGTIVLVGNYKSNHVFRLKSNGILDSSFNDNGLIYLGDISIQNLRIDNNSNIIACSQIGDMDNVKTVIHRILANGKIDLTFTNDLWRKNYYYNRFGIQERGFSVEISNDNSFYVLGERLAEDHYNASILKLKSDGSVDSSFQNYGLAQYTLGTAGAGFNVVRTDKNKKHLIAGVLHKGRGYKFAFFMRLGSDGTIDSSFANNGWISYDFGVENQEHHNNTISDCYIDHLNRIVFAGFCRDMPNKQKGLIGRINSDGSIDTSFIHKGYYLLPETFQFQEPTAVSKINAGTNDSLHFLVNSIYPFGGQCEYLKTDKYGKFNNSFGDNGILKFGSDFISIDFNINDHDELLMWGKRQAGPNHLELLKISSNGSLFSLNQSFEFSHALAGASNSFFYTIDGNSNNGVIKISRRQEDGATDLSFGTQGYTSFFNDYTYNHSSFFDHDSNIVILSQDYNHLNLVKVDKEGVRDLDFGSNGSIDFNINHEPMYVHNGEITLDNNILVIGNLNDSTSFIVKLKNEKNIDGIHETPYTVEPEVYPVPVKDILTIRPINGIPLKVQLVDMYGREVLYTEGSSLDCSKIDNGLYSIILQNGMQRYIYKIVISH